VFANSFLSFLITYFVLASPSARRRDGLERCEHDLKPTTHVSKLGFP